MTKHTQPAHTNQREKTLDYPETGKIESLHPCLCTRCLQARGEELDRAIKSHDATLLARIEGVIKDINPEYEEFIDGLRVAATLIQEGDNEK